MEKSTLIKPDLTTQPIQSRAKFISLYQQDFAIWCAQTITKLNAREFDNLDVENLVEEIGSLASRDRREVKTRIIVFLCHLLKRKYLPLPENFRGWALTIDEQSEQLNDILEQSPSLKIYLEEIFVKAWAIALRRTQAEYPDYRFPSEFLSGCLPKLPFGSITEITNLLSSEYPWKLLKD